MYMTTSGGATGISAASATAGDSGSFPNSGATTRIPDSRAAGPAGEAAGAAATPTDT